MVLLYRWKKNRLVNSAMSLRRASAINAVTNPIPMARHEIHRARGGIVKSPSVSAPPTVGLTFWFNFDRKPNHIPHIPVRLDPPTAFLYAEIPANKNPTMEER
jgi:hypothetical protein